MDSVAKQRGLGDQPRHLAAHTYPLPTLGTLSQVGVGSCPSPALTKQLWVPALLERSRVSDTPPGTWSPTGHQGLPEGTLSC